MNNLREVSGLERQARKGGLRGLFRRAADSYFKIRDFEKDGRLYRATGAELVSRYWFNGGSYWAKRTSQRWYVSGKKDLQNFVRETKKVEATHSFVLFPLFTSLSLGFAVLGSVVSDSSVANSFYTGAGLFLAADYVGNILPIASQRYHRNRVLKLIERIEKRKEQS